MVWPRRDPVQGWPWDGHPVYTHIYDSSYHISPKLSVNAADQGILVRLGCKLKFNVEFLSNTVLQ